MTRPPLRVAFFTDCFHEVNGVALTSRQFFSFAQRHDLPFLAVHAGPEARLTRHGNVASLEVKRGPLSIPLDADLSFDTLFLRRMRHIRAELEQFQPDLVHVTSPGDFGILGAILAHKLGLPLAASWHTNIHEFGARRLERRLSMLPASRRAQVARWAERGSLALAVRFYRLARVLYAPNIELSGMLVQRTGRPVYLMTRGIDTNLFHPGRRDRNDGDLVLGFVGRIKAEKNVRFFADVEAGLNRAGVTNYRFHIVGQGSEAAWLRSNLRRAEFLGVLKGEALARAYANMDVLVFPSHTDTYGNAVQEALASGVPAVVTASGGPKYLVQHGETGFVAQAAEDFCRHVVELATAPLLLQKLKAQTAASVASRSWDEVFQRVYEGYRTIFRPVTAAEQPAAAPKAAQLQLW